MRISDWSSDVCSSDLHLGLGAAHRAATGGSTFAGDIHLTYRRELREGDPLRVTSQLLGFDEKRLRFFQHMYHAEEGFLAATMESLGLSVDLARRRVAPFPAAIRSEGRRVGKEGVSQCRSGWSPVN